MTTTSQIAVLPFLLCCERDPLLRQRGGLLSFVDRTAAPAFDMEIPLRRRRSLYYTPALKQEQKIRSNGPLGFIFVEGKPLGCQKSL